MIKNTISKNILVIEDGESIQIIPDYALHEDGYILDTALNGRKVLDKILDRYERIGDPKISMV